MPMKKIEKEKNSLLAQMDEARETVRRQSALVPEVAIVLGTGLGNLAKKIEANAVIPYVDIPYFPKTTVESHAGQLILGTLSGKKVAALQGRFHYYEGYSPAEIVFPVRVMKALGAKQLWISNAAGGLNLTYRKGDIVLIDDMINFMGINPLIGPNDDRVGLRFSDLSAPFSARLTSLAHETAEKEKIRVHRGVYIGVTGPNLETRAEYRMMRGFGADVVGMSTVPEVIAGVHMNMEILGLSVVTDVCDPENLHPVDISEIIKTANEAGPKLDKLIERTLALL